MKNDNYIILINKEGSPVLVEVPEKPKFSAWDLMSPAVDTDTPIRNYNEALQQAISDTSKHIQIKNWQEALCYARIEDCMACIDHVGNCSQCRQTGKYFPEQHFPLPSNVSVSFEDLCNCELSALQGTPTTCFVCLRPREHKLAILTESTTKQHTIKDLKML